MEAQAFISMIAPAAAAFQQKGGPFASVTIAQAILETGYGQFLPVDSRTGQPSYNLFGVKGTGTTGSVYAATEEVYGGKTESVMAYFAAYNSFEESLEGHFQFLLHGYDPVLHAATPEVACEALQACGYATDPQYAEKLISLIHQYQLNQYDKQEDDEMTEQERELLQSLAALAPAPEPEWFKNSGVEEKLVKLGATWSGTKSPVFYEALAVLDRAGIYDDALKARGLK